MNKRFYKDSEDEGTFNDSTWIVPEGTVYVENSHAGDENLTSVTIPKSTIQIMWNAFRGCTNLQTINLPDSVTYVEYTDQRGVFKITEHRPFKSLVDVVVNQGLSVIIHTDDGWSWD